MDVDIAGTVWQHIANTRCHDLLGPHQGPIGHMSYACCLPELERCEDGDCAHVEVRSWSIERLEAGFERLRAPIVAEDRYSARDRVHAARLPGAASGARSRRVQLTATIPVRDEVHERAVAHLHGARELQQPFRFGSGPIEPVPSPDLAVQHRPACCIVEAGDTLISLLGS
jgi:hypothetical protein